MTLLRDMPRAVGYNSASRMEILQQVAQAYIQFLQQVAQAYIQYFRASGNRLGCMEVIKLALDFPRVRAAQIIFGLGGLKGSLAWSNWRLSLSAAPRYT